MQDERGHGVPAEEGLAELTGGDVPQPLQVLHGQRSREAQVLHDARAVRRRHLGVTLHAENGHQGIAGQDAQHHEDDQGHPDQRAEGEDRPPEEVLPHAPWRPYPWAIQTWSQRTTS